MSDFNFLKKIKKKIRTKNKKKILISTIFNQK